MLDVATIQIINDKIEELISDNKCFTAYDITVSIRHDGLKESHREVRKIVHAFYEDGEFDDYERSLIQIVGAPRKAYLYHPTNANPNDYIKKTNKVASKGRHRQPGNLDSEGRLNVPSAMMREAGFTAGDKFSLASNHDGTIQVLATSDRHSILIDHRVSSRGNFRISQKDLLTCGFNNNKMHFKIYFDDDDVLTIE